MKKIILTVALALGLVAWGEGAKPTAAIPGPRPCVGKVTKVSDGDTIWVLERNNQKQKVRLDRIDAPEMSQPFGKEAQEHLAKLILGKTVCVMWRERDQYGRILGIVYAGESDEKSDLNLRLVKEGYAWHYSHFDKTPEYAAAEKEARAAKRGLWAAPDPINPYQWRKAHR